MSVALVPSDGFDALGLVEVLRFGLSIDDVHVLRWIHFARPGVNSENLERQLAPRRVVLHALLDDVTRYLHGLSRSAAHGLRDVHMGCDGAAEADEHSDHANYYNDERDDVRRFHRSSCSW